MRTASELLEKSTRIAPWTCTPPSGPPRRVVAATGARHRIASSIGPAHFLKESDPLIAANRCVPRENPQQGVRLLCHRFRSIERAAAEELDARAVLCALRRSPCSPCETTGGRTAKIVLPAARFAPGFTRSSQRTAENTETCSAATAPARQAGRKRACNKGSDSFCGALTPRAPRLRVKSSPQLPPNGTVSPRALLLVSRRARSGQRAHRALLQVLHGSDSLHSYSLRALGSSPRLRAKPQPGGRRDSPRRHALGLWFHAEPAEEW
jgi:hypothetical protein